LSSLLSPLESRIGADFHAASRAVNGGWLKIVPSTSKAKT